MRRHVLESGQQEREKLLVRHTVVLDFLSVSGLIRHVVGRVGHDQVGLDAVHERIHRIRRGTVSTHHAVPAQCPDVAGLYIYIDRFRIDLTVIVMYILVMHLGEEIIHLGSVKACRAEIVSGALQILQQVSQGRRLPVASGFVERDVQRFFI